MTTRYKSKDYIRAVWKGFVEGSYGTKPGAEETVEPFTSHLYELAFRPDPHSEPIYVCRGEEATHGVPLALLSHFKEYRLRLGAYQPTLTDWTVGWLHDHLDEPSVTNNHTNFWLEAQIKRSDAIKFYMQAWGIKVDAVTIRCAREGRIEWLLDCIAQEIDTSDATTVTAYTAELGGDPWLWAQSYVEYQTNGGFTLLPEVEDWEFVIRKNLNQIRVFNAAGTYTVSALEDMERRYEATFTLLCTGRTLIDHLLDQQDVDLRLNLPDSKNITFTDGKFIMPADAPIIRMQDFLRVRLSYYGKTCTHNF